VSELTSKLLQTIEIIEKIDPVHRSVETMF